MSEIGLFLARDEYPPRELLSQGVRRPTREGNRCSSLGPEALRVDRHLRNPGLGVSNTLLKEVWL